MGELFAEVAHQRVPLLFVDRIEIDLPVEAQRLAGVGSRQIFLHLVQPAQRDLQDPLSGPRRPLQPKWHIRRQTHAVQPGLTVQCPSRQVMPTRPLSAVCTSRKSCAGCVSTVTASPYSNRQTLSALASMP